MIQNMNEWKVAITAIFAGLTAVWGWLGWLAVAFVVCMIVDYATGTMAASMAGEWSSKAARDGIGHKVGCLIMVFVAGMTDLVVITVLEVHPEIQLPFDYNSLFCTMVMIWYVITELGSIAENAAKMGAPVPKFLRNALAVLNNAIDHEEESTDIAESK